MNWIARAWSRYLLREAARQHRRGTLNESDYGVFAVRVMLRLAGRELAPDDRIGGLVLGDDVLVRALGREVYSATGVDPALEQQYGPFLSAPTFARNMMGQRGAEFEWGTYPEDLYKRVRDRLHPAARFEAWVKAKRERYPVLTTWSGRLFWILVGAVLGKLRH